VTRPLKAAWCDQVAEDPGLTTTQKAVAWRLASYANADGTNTRPSHERLARECGLKNRETVGRAIKELLHRGYVVLTVKANPNLGVKTNTYALAFPDGALAPEPRDSTVTWSQDEDDLAWLDDVTPQSPGRGDIGLNHVTPQSGRRDSGVGDDVTPQSHNQSLDQPSDHFVSLGHDRDASGDDGGDDHDDDWDEAFDGPPFVSAPFNPAPTYADDGPPLVTAEGEPVASPEARAAYLAQMRADLASKSAKNGGRR
jgi:hypothetical protein